MAEMTDYLENEIYDHVLRNAAYTSPATIYVSLHTADPTESGQVGEVAGNGYARQSVTFGPPSNGSGSNSNTITFTATGGNWGTVTHFAIHDALTVGNALMYSILDNSRVVNDGDDFEFAISALTASFA